MRLIVLDFDGVIIENGRAEKIGRKIFKKFGFKNPPKIFFDIYEIINIFKKCHSPKPEIKAIIQKCRQENCFLGLITDESLFSITRFFKNNKEVSLSDFYFIQTRKSFLNKFSGMINLVELMEKPRLHLSKSPKPSSQNLINIKNFAKEKNIKNNEIIFIDDLKEARAIYKKEGFLAISQFKNSSI